MAAEQVVVGDVVHGFCSGLFGRDYHTCSRVEAVGSDWVVVRGIERFGVNFATSPTILHDLVEFTRIPYEQCSCETSKYGWR